jgi:hypothetical protein
MGRRVIKADVYDFSILRGAAAYSGTADHGMWCSPSLPAPRGRARSPLKADVYAFSID